MADSTQTEQPPRKGAHGLAGVALQRYATNSPFLIDPNTYVVAVVGGDAETASPEKDGWLCSDFYAFNYLFKGLGRKQAWIASAVRCLPAIIN